MLLLQSDGAIDGATVGAHIQITDEQAQGLVTFQDNIAALTTRIGRDTTNTNHYPMTVQGKYGRL